MPQGILGPHRHRAAETVKTSTLSLTICRSLGLALKATRRSVPISLAALSDKSGVAMSCISVIERGESNPTIDTIHRLSSAMGTTAATVLRFAEKLQ